MVADTLIKDFDDKFVEYYFPDDPDYVLGSIGESALFPCGDFSAVVPEMSERDIDAAIERIAAEHTGLDQLIVEIKNQLREGSCVSQAVVQADQVGQAKEVGKDRVILLSAISVYKEIAESANSGAVVSHGLKQISKVGALPLDTPENRKRFDGIVMPNTGFNEKYPKIWTPTANLFRVSEYYAIRTLRALMTALCNRIPVVVGREGHSICYLVPVRYKGRWGVLYANSWGEWGIAGGDFERGFGIDTASQIEKSARYAFAVRAVHNPQLYRGAA